ncbi:MAG: hypothetical protein J6033_02935 [Lachnospiraceae bacterium]|nr:hypothetical protein [Lachnospiraceae bacterium]
MKKQSIGKNLIAAMMVLTGLFTNSITAFGADKGTLSIEGVLEVDEVVIYKIVGYDSVTGYEFNEAVTDWIEDKGTDYKGLTPAKLFQMTEERAEEFFELLLTGSRGETQEDEVEKISDSPLFHKTYIGSEDYDIAMDPGFYLILPIGENRIYKMKWTKISAGEEVELSYTDNEDYIYPTIENTLTKEDEVESEEPEDSIFAVKDDTITVTSEISLPQYPDIYSRGKTVENIYILIPEDITYIEDSFDITLDDDLYGEQSFTEATIYRDSEGKEILFESEDWFYNLDGSTVNEPDLTELTEDEGYTIKVISLDTEEAIESLTIEYQLLKDDTSNDTGIYETDVGIIYSISPMNTNLHGNLKQPATVNSYGISATVCEGTGYTQNSDREEVLENARRLGGATFMIYKFTGKTYEGDLTDSLGHSGTEGGDAVGENEDEGNVKYYEYDRDRNLTIEYEQVKQITCDSQGVANIGGLDKAAYMIRQTGFPNGYEYAIVSLYITDSAWDDEDVMEGNYIISTLWLDYPTVYLPETGKRGIGGYVLAGILISGFALIELIANKYSFDKHH